MPGTLAKGGGNGITDRFSSKISLWFETSTFRGKREVDKTAEPMKSFFVTPPFREGNPHDPYPSAAESVGGRGAGRGRRTPPGGG